MQDYGDLVNALQEGPSAPAIASFEIEWTESKDRHRFYFEPHQWDANLVFNAAKVAWSAKTETAMFVSDPAPTSTTLFAEVGHERSGVFFPQG
jgi:hypothetical protein